MAANFAKLPELLLQRPNINGVQREWYCGLTVPRVHRGFI